MRMAELRKPVKPSDSKLDEAPDNLELEKKTKADDPSPAVIHMWQLLIRHNSVWDLIIVSLQPSGHTKPNGTDS